MQVAKTTAKDAAAANDLLQLQTGGGALVPLMVGGTAEWNCFLLVFEISV
jgi:hypothetical protein